MSDVWTTDFDLAGALNVCHALPESEREVYEVLGGEKYNCDAAAAQAWGAPGLKWLFMADREPIAIGGFTPMSPSTYRTWFYATERAWEQHGKGLTVEVARLIDWILDEEMVYRVETVTLASQTRARAWYEKIGLQQESTLRGFGAGGADAVMYVAVRRAEAG